MRTFLVNTALVFCAILVGLVFLEIMVRLYFFEPDHVRTLMGVSNESKLQFIPGQVLKVEGDEFAYVQRSNSYGRRDRHWNSEIFARPENIILIGDSFVMGAGVPDEFKLDYLLESKLKSSGQGDVEVFNFGIGGEIAIKEYKQLLEHALKLNISAKTVIVAIFIGNDFSLQRSVVKSDPAADVSKNGSKWFDLRLIEFIKQKVSNSPTLVGLTLKLGQIVGIETYVSPAAYLFKEEYSSHEKEVFQTSLNYIGDIKSISDSNNLELVFVIIPNKIQVENWIDLSNGMYIPEKPNAKIMRYCEKIGISCLDLLPILRREFENGVLDIYYPKDRHFTPVGTEIAAQAIYSFLIPHM